MRARARLFAGVAVVAVATCAWLSVPVLGQRQEDKNAPKLDKQQTQEIQAIVKYLDDLSAGKAAAPDATLTWQPYFVKSQGMQVYVPFTVTLDPGKLNPKALAVYFRVVSKTPAAAAAEKKGDKAPAQYAFEDLVFTTLPAAEKGPIQVSRAFAVPTGDYDVYVVLRERPERDQKTAPKLALLKEPVTVPDLSSALTTSSIILADKIEAQTAQLSRDEQLNQPFTFGGTAILPATSTSFPKTGELSLVFFLYNTGVDSANKPNVDVEYNFHTTTNEGEKFFNKTNPQSFNAQTLPPQFDVSKGHQLIAGQSVPLASFEPGLYRLEIKVTDKTSPNKSIMRNVPFTVTEQPSTPVGQLSPNTGEAGTIRSKCAKDWPDDFSMRAYCESRQNEARAVLQARQMTSDDMRTIRDKCTRDWADDFSMRNYCEEQQLKALRSLQK